MNNSPNLFRDIQLVYLEQEQPLADHCGSLLSQVSGLDQAAERNERQLLLSNDLSLATTSTSQPVDGLSWVKTHQATQYLGKELDFILFDARDGFDLNSFAAICGCLVASGLILVILPANFKENLSSSLTLNYQGRACLSRLISQVDELFSPPLKQKFDAISGSIPSQKALSQQQQVIAQIKSCATGHARRPLVISANRGRGKSAALGIACAEIIFETGKPIFICSTRMSNLQVFYKHFSNRWLSLSSVSCNKNISKESATNLMVFLPPDKMVDIEPTNQLLIIEEAASIPVQMLKLIRRKSNRLIFSTTLDGYEGNGQGFDLRFLPYLKKEFRQVKQAKLSLPMRWCADDPLEKAINRAFLLSFGQASCEELGDSTPFSAKAIQYKQVDKKTLHQDQPLLQEIFKLLVTAHYQTRPSDLEALLSDPNWLVFIAYHQERLVAASIVCREGGIDTKTCELIEQGKQRLKGHLLPQSLMAYKGIEQAGEFNYWRIIRIAVQPHLRRKKVATRLIDFIKNQSITEKVDLLGSSFAMHEDVLSFWYSCGFQCSRVALKKDSSTGSYPAEFLYNKNNHLVYNKSIEDFNQVFIASLASTNKYLDPKLLVIILENQMKKPSQHFCLQDYSIKEVERYLDKARSFEMVEWHLFYFIIEHWLNKKSDAKISLYDKQLLILKIFQKHSWLDMSQHLSNGSINNLGTKHFQEKLRASIKRLYHQG